MFKKLLIFTLFFFLFEQNTFANNFIEKTIDWYKFRVIKYDTQSLDYIFKIWINQDYAATDLRELMEANNWVSAVNWVFFCPDSYAECGWKNFTKNERYVEWTKIWPEASTWNRVVFAVDKEDKAFLFQTDKINRLDEDKIHYGFANFPLLLQDWVSKFQEYVDLWLVDNKMKAKIQRNFICSDRYSRNIFTWYVSAIELEKLPDLLLKFWCVNALNLDAGWSSALIYNARYLIWPARDIMDWVIIERKWLDTAKIRENAVKIKDYLNKKIIDKTIEEKVLYLDNMMSWLSKIRTNIYEKNSHDIYENWVVVGYEINVKDLKKVQTTYLINYLNKLLSELKTQSIADDKKRVEEENNRKNIEELLF